MSKKDSDCQQLRGDLAALRLEAIALAHKAIHAGHRVYCTTVADLVARTEKALEGRWASTMRFWNGPAVLVGRAGLPADARRVGLSPLPGDQPSLRERVDRLDDQPGDRRLGEIVEDTTVATAILDRLLHHATVITVAGDSYRMRSHRDALKTARSALSGG